MEDPKVEVEEDGEASQTSSNGERRKVPAGGAKDDGDACGATIGNDVEDTGNHDPAIQLDYTSYHVSPLSSFLFWLYCTSFSFLLQSLNFFW